MKLTKNQISVLKGGKHWSEPGKAKFLMSSIRSFGIDIELDKLGWFIDEFVPSEENRIKREYFQDSISGKRINNLTPTDLKGIFDVVDSPIIGEKYHISWAFSGAVFKLKRIEGDVCYLDNPRHKREKLLKCHVSELRHLSKNSNPKRV